MMRMGAVDRPRRFGLLFRRVMNVSSKITTRPGPPNRSTNSAAKKLANHSRNTRQHDAKVLRSTPVEFDTVWASSNWEK